MSSFTTFLESELGQALLDLEREAMAAQLSQLVGYNCLQLSVQRGASMCPDGRFGQLIKMGYAPSADAGLRDSVWANYEELPVASDCVDVAVLHHVLEFAEQPHQLLREATRTLTAGGHLLVAGFNPLSLWPVYHRFYRWRNAAPPAPQRKEHRQRSIRQGRLADWLSLLNYEVLDQQCLFYRPPINSVAWLRRLRFCERWGGYSHLPVGLVYLTLARKRSVAATPVMSGWRRSLSATPAARVRALPLQRVIDSLEKSTKALPQGIAKQAPTASQNRNRSTLRRIK
ncbi:MAG: methyltransferase domain-containing protein [Pseudomonadales bacterium]